MSDYWEELSKGRLHKLQKEGRIKILPKKLDGKVKLSLFDRVKVWYTKKVISINKKL